MTSESYVIVGGGHAARRAAEALRMHDADVPITIVGAEAELPYDRPVLSKDALVGIEGERKAFIRDAAWYATQRIDMRLGTAVTAIDRDAKCIHLADGTQFPYRKALLATGSRVRRLDVPVDTDACVHYVRTVDDTRALRDVLSPGKRVVVLGGGFIGLEVAASAASLGCRVSVIEPAARLLQRALPEQVATYVMALHQRHGVDIRLGVAPLAVRRSSVETDAGVFEADVVVAGIGVVPNTELAQAAGLEVRNGIVVDAGCRTVDPDVFAAGEVTCHFNPLLGRHLRVESWQVAENQPAVAAANMLGADERYAEWPWLWSDQYACNLQTLGIFDPSYSVVVRASRPIGKKDSKNIDESGDRSGAGRSGGAASERAGEQGTVKSVEIDHADAALTVFALRHDSTLAAVATINAGRDIGPCKRLIGAAKALDPAALADPAVPLRSLI